MENLQIISDLIFKYKECFSTEDYLIICNSLKNIHEKIKYQSSSEYSDSNDESESTTVSSDDSEIIQYPRSIHWDMLHVIKTEIFEQFIIQNYRSHMEELEYNEDGKILINLRKINVILRNYILHNNLLSSNSSEDVQMDITLKNLFPSHVERYDSDGNLICAECLRMDILTSAVRLNNHIDLE